MKQSGHLSKGFRQEPVTKGAMKNTIKVIFVVKDMESPNFTVSTGSDRLHVLFAEIPYLKRKK